MAELQQEIFCLRTQAAEAEILREHSSSLEQRLERMRETESQKDSEVQLLRREKEKAEQDRQEEMIKMKGLEDAVARVRELEDSLAALSAQHQSKSEEKGERPQEGLGLLSMYCGNNAHS